MEPRITPVMGDRVITILGMSREDMITPVKPPPVIALPLAVPVAALLLPMPPL
jgi:hypothetical protein